MYYWQRQEMDILWNVILYYCTTYLLAGCLSSFYQLVSYSSIVAYLFHYFKILLLEKVAVEPHCHQNCCSICHHLSFFVFGILSYYGSSISSGWDDTYGFGGWQRHVEWLEDGSDFGSSGLDWSIGYFCDYHAESIFTNLNSDRNCCSFSMANARLLRSWNFSHSSKSHFLKAFAHRFS